MVKKNETIKKASKGYIEKYYDSSKSLFNSQKPVMGLMPEFDREKALDAVRKDSTVIAAINTLVDRSMENGYRITGDDGKSRDKEAEKKLRDLRFNKILRQIFYNLYAYGNVFVENVKDGNDNIKELHILETTITEPISTVHGQIEGYTQITPDDTNAPFWNPNEVSFMTTTKLTTNVWGELDIQAVYTSVLIKEYIYAYLGWLFGTNQLKSFYNIKNANEKQVKNFVSWLKRSQDDITKPLIAEGEVEATLLRDFTEGDNIMKVLEKCDNNILTLFQVPPVAMGLPGDSNRSNSDAQDSALNTRIRSVQEIVEDECKYDLFRKMGFTKINLEFEAVQKADIDKLLENAERMKNIGFTPNKVQEYLLQEGFPLDGKLIDDEMYKSGTEKSMDMFASRQGKSQGEGNKRIGTGKEGTTREDQLISKGRTKIIGDISMDGVINGLVRPKIIGDIKKGFGTYPYIIE